RVRTAHRRHRPRVAWCADIAATALHSIYPSLPNWLPFITLARLAIAFAVLIAPTALMGATLPLVIKSSTFRTSGLGERMALLYGMNTAGAITGALMAGLYLIQTRGIHATFFVAAALNLFVGL